MAAISIFPGGSRVHTIARADARHRSVPVSVTFIAREVCNASATERTAGELVWIRYSKRAVDALVQERT